jgi:hypothetical protein
MPRARSIAHAASLARTNEVALRSENANPGLSTGDAEIGGAALRCEAYFLGASAAGAAAGMGTPET